MSAKSFGLSPLLLGLFLVAISIPSLSIAGELACSGLGRCSAGYLTRRLVYNFVSKKWVWRVDPSDIEGFHLDVGFDPARAQFESISYLSGFTQTTPPDLSQLSNGLVQDIAGSTASPVPGDVDLFEVVFNDLHPEQPIDSTFFSAFASSNDFIAAFDPQTNDHYNIPPGGIVPATASVPEPSTALFALAAIAIGAVATGKRRRRVGCN